MSLLHVHEGLEVALLGSPAVVNPRNCQYLEPEKRCSEQGTRGKNLLRPGFPAGANEEDRELAILEDLGVDIVVEMNAKDKSGGINDIKGGGRLNNLVSHGGEVVNVAGLESRLLEDTLDGLAAGLF